MRATVLALLTALAVSASACGATTGTSTTGAATPVAVTSGTVTFMTHGDGKDEDSAIAVQLLEDDSRLSGEATVVDQDFDANTVSPPINLTMTRALNQNDLNDVRVRLRLTPDGRDTWLFDMRLALRFSDGTERQYFWGGLRLDEGAPERTLTLTSGRLP